MQPRIMRIMRIDIEIEPRIIRIMRMDTGIEDMRGSDGIQGQILDF